VPELDIDVHDKAPQVKYPEPTDRPYGVRIAELAPPLTKYV